ncbi:1-acyl-sn-glycerol-3-phosphate acyltransferase [Flavobacterium sp. SUN052]|uniref:1-acyl-sn-glycerol-3-phosphate acyltransferase n=1 Tax=Flavobacterium sp. SUN052 TaxID=3002441 RepID=UPI00237DE505|nr:1-acyl-sn-glycerol-3-phosphate acyltransferase [Flavobacterium sp. SUN052]MEC4004371.1 1-acyl-sn-glycerol-3-phosphate acyltransferase [Flavobacterium sp. SUN052]
MYKIFKIAAFLAIKIYCRKTVAIFENIPTKNLPRIIASNHPNSFFDAIVIAVHYPKPIYFLARGDAFKNPMVAKFLKALHLIPIYRLSEGKENLIKNTATFETCIELLKQNQTILIFSEGICKNEWNLRPLKKGTARLALLALNNKITNLEIQPTTINYSSFSKNPKEVSINFNLTFKPIDLPKTTEAVFYNAFNILLKQRISSTLIVEHTTNEINLFQKSNSKFSSLRKVLFAIPALVGFALNFWIYKVFKNITQHKTKNTVFYDSVLFGLLLIGYPIITLLLALAVSIVFNFKIGVLLFVIMPLSAWFYKLYKSI